MRYEEALLDANLAHNLSPTHKEAYRVLADLLTALNENEKALKILKIISLNDDGQDKLLKSQLEMMKTVVALKKPDAKSKQFNKM